MLKYICFVLLYFVATTSLCQHLDFLSVAFAGGLGGAVYQQHDPDRARITGAFQPTVRVSKNFFVAIEGSASGRFTVVGFYGGQQFDPSTNTITLSPYNQRSNALLAKIRFVKGRRSTYFFSALGAGVNRYFYNWPVNNVKAVSRTNPAIQAELGVALKRFEFSLTFLKGGRTPEYQHVGANNIVTELKSIRIDSWSLMSAYRLRFLK